MYDFCFTLPYGMLLIAGGLMGYLTSGSTKSLIAGGASGAALLLLGNVSLRYYQKGRLCKAATVTSLLISVALTAVMHKRYTDTGKIMPAGLLMVASGVMAAFYVWNLVAGPKAPDVKVKKRAKKAA